MALFNLTAAARTPPANYSADTKTREALATSLDRGVDKVWKRDFQEPWMGEALFRPMKVKYQTGKMSTFRDWAGFVPIRRDADDMSYATKGDGFDWDWQTYTYGRGIKIEKADIEQDDIGATKGGTKALINAFKRTVEYTLADVWNRAFGVDGAPVLADDGMYLIDSNRPNPNPEGGLWSNLEATAEITEESLWAAALNAKQQVSEDGNLFPQKIMKMVVGPVDKRTIWRVLNTQGVLGSNYNDRNWAASAFDMDQVIEYDYLTTRAIFYLLCDPKSEDNELLVCKRVEPTVETGWGATPNQNVLYHTLRADFGVALGSPRKFVRGGLVTDGSSS